MIIHTCDVCSKASEPATMEVNGIRGVPLGWFRRSGRVGRGKDISEIVVICCSEQCCKAYDKLEAEQVGFAWGKMLVTSEDEEHFVVPTLLVKPLRG